MTDRLRAIGHCADELALARAARSAAKAAHRVLPTGENFGILLWELDWLTELHRLLYQ